MMQGIAKMFRELFHFDDVVRLRAMLAHQRAAERAAQVEHDIAVARVDHEANELKSMADRTQAAAVGAARIFSGARH